VTDWKRINADWFSTWLIGRGARWGFRDRAKVRHNREATGRASIVTPGIASDRVSVEHAQGREVEARLGQLQDEGVFPADPAADCTGGLVVGLEQAMSNDLQLLAN